MQGQGCPLRECAGVCRKPLTRGRPQRPALRRYALIQDMLVDHDILQGVHGQEIAQDILRGVIIDPPDTAKLADIDMGTIIQIGKQTFYGFTYLQ